MDARTDKKILIFVGRSGNGKSYCVKSIEKASNINLITRECLGVGDNQEDLTVDKKLILTNVKKLVEELDIKYEGIDAIVLVMKYGVRFTKQDKEAVAIVKSYFGESVLNTRGILVFTYGDNFFIDNMEHGKDFKQWCIEQTGCFKELFDEVHHRCVLFNNKTEKQTENEKQVTELLKHVDSIGQEKYRLEDFKKHFQSPLFRYAKSAKTQMKKLFSLSS